MMSKIKCLFFFILSAWHFSYAQENWSARLYRKDSVMIPFSIQWTTLNKNPVWVIKNAKERITVNQIETIGDSIFVQMPLFESQFRGQIHAKGKFLSGIWLKGSLANPTVMPFTAHWQQNRFGGGKPGRKNIGGRWEVFFENSKYGSSVGEFVQKGNKVTGTFLNATGDFRFLEGVVDADTLRLSCFDGSHAFLFTAIIKDAFTLRDGVFYSGATFKQRWHAVKNKQAKVQQDNVAIYTKPGEEYLHFSFADLDSNLVSIRDERFKNKVVVIQLMGSWCPNCMDESAFLSDFYKKYKQQGVEVIALAYENSTQWQRSVKNLKKFKDRFDIQYPLLITGVTVNDSLRTEKTLPEITPIRFFPSSIILDKRGKIRKLDTGFNGPGTGIHFQQWQNEFFATIHELLKED